MKRSRTHIGCRRQRLAMQRKKLYITDKNCDAILAKANALVNQGVSLKRVLQRCRLSYKQLLKLSKMDGWIWTDAVMWRENYKGGNTWCADARVEKMREFACMARDAGLNKKHISFLLGRSQRTINRYWASQRSSENDGV